MSSAFQLDGRRIRLTNLDRVLWPERGWTKGDLIRYVIRAAPAVLPFLQDRPLALRRYPHGIQGESFVQKACPDYAPDWIMRHTVESGSGREIPFIICNDRATLVWLANQGAIEIHPWHARRQHLEAPDWIVFDLDPVPPHGVEAAADLAAILKKRLHGLGLRGWVKTSGGRGIHVYVPLGPKHTHDQARMFARLVAQILRQELPGVVSLERRPQDRSGRVYIDVDQNGRGKTLAAAFLPRGRPGGAISMPVGWADIPGLDPQQFTLEIRTQMLQAGLQRFRGLLREGYDLEVTMQGMKGQLGGRISSS